MKFIKSIYNSKSNFRNLYHCPGQLLKPEEPLQKTVKDAANLGHKDTRTSLEIIIGITIGIIVRITVVYFLTM